MNLALQMLIQLLTQNYVKSFVGSSIVLESSVQFYHMHNKELQIKVLNKNKEAHLETH